MRVLAIVHQADAPPGVFAEAVAAAGHALEVWHPASGAPAPAEPARYGALLTFGGGMNPDQEGSHPWMAEEKGLLASALKETVPVLAVCLGAELLAQAAGGTARRAARPEIGWYPVRATAEAQNDPLMHALPPGFEALEWHSYESLPPATAVPLARSETCLQAYRVGERAWGVQFHAEVRLATFESWLERYAEDADAVKLGINPGRLRDQTRRAIGNWNRMGHALCTRFLDIAARGETRCAAGSPRVGEARSERGGTDGDRKDCRT